MAKRKIHTSVICLALTATVLLAGCQSMGGTSLRQWYSNGFKVGPNHCPPTATVANHWRNIDWQDNGPAAIDHTEWWLNFNDPILNGLISEAACSNLDIRQAGFRVLQARAARRVEAGSIFPQSQTASGSYARTQRPALLISDAWSQGFAVAWELDFWGEFRRRIEAADANLLESEFDRTNILICLYSDIGETYVTIRSLQSQIATAQRNLESQTKQLDEQKAAAERNMLLNQPISPQELVKYETAAAIAALETSLVQAENKLAILLGITPAEIRAITIENYGVVPVHAGDIALLPPVELIRRRPDVLKAEQAVAEQCARVGIAITDLYPSFSLVGSSAWGGPDFDNMFESANLTASIAPQFSWKILNYGRIQGNIEGQKAKLQELCAAYQEAVLVAQQEIEDARIAYSNARYRHDMFGRAAQAAQDAIDDLTNEDSWLNNLDDTFNLAPLLASKVANDNNRISTEAEIASNLIKLYKAVGGGWAGCVNSRCVTEDVRFPEPEAPFIKYTEPVAVRVETMGGEAENGSVQEAPVMPAELQYQDGSLP